MQHRRAREDFAQPAARVARSEQDPSRCDAAQVALARTRTALRRGARTALALVSVIVCASFASGATALAAQSTAAGREIVLGFDGADARTTQEMMERGELPNLAKLREQGTFAPLGTTTPAESPVSWAALNCGQNPGKTGIPGFVKRQLSSAGVPTPALGFQVHEPRKTESFPLSGLVRQLVARSAAANAAIAGVLVALGFWLLLALLLRVRKIVACALALSLGALGAWGGWTATESIPRTIADVVGNPIRTAGFWETAAKSGVACVVLDGAMSWDRPQVDGVKLLSGLGVPDVRGDTGDWFVYTTDPGESGRPPEGRTTSTGGRVFSVDEVESGRIESKIYGPLDFCRVDKLQRELEAISDELTRGNSSDARRSKLDDRKRAIEEIELPAAKGETGGEDGRLSVPLVVEKLARDPHRARVTIGGEGQELAAGAWSDWYHLTFESNALFKVKAITRVKLVALDPFSLYVDFLQIDPRAQPYWQTVSRPEGFGRDLAKAIGMPFETVGWACMTMPFKDREIDPPTFLEDIEFTESWREKLLGAALKKNDWRLLFNVESTPDRVQHMMYQYFDASHPKHDAATAASKARYFGRDIALSDAIPATYREMDRVVGEVMGALRPGDTLIVCSDHGFQSYRSSVNLNNWLYEHKYLAVRQDLDRSNADALMFVDWQHTRAYALGLGMIFLNLEGREREGIVKVDEASALMDGITRDLLATRDGEKPVVRSVYRTSTIHSGPFVPLEADLMTGFEAGYRVGWSTTTGGIRVASGSSIPGKSIEPNNNNWSGDHVSVSEDLVRGIFFCNRKVAIPKDGINLLHIAPTVLSVLGVATPSEYDLSPLQFVQ
jgi:predicted AlkP superfamily phosphohydrolase/phosphomutase